MQITRQIARRMAINCQLLDNRTRFPKGREGVARTIEHLGYVQIDTISVIERAHHHTIWSRRPDYDESMLHELQAADRRIFEYWGHAASYLPMSDYRYYLPVMNSFKDPKDKWAKNRLEKCGHLLEPILKRITAEGPLASSDFESGDHKSGNWWDWKPAKTALELLFWQGKLMITERRNFNRVYDLTGRVLPSDVDISVPSGDDLGRFLVRRALNAYGVAGEKEIRSHIHTGNIKMINKALSDLIEADEIIAVTIKGMDKKYYALKTHVETAMKRRRKKAEVYFLSPFDNLIIQRDRTKTLFGFDYTLECYVPASKRVYGYFVLPVLYGEQFAGRMDCKAERKTKTLIVRNLVMEDGVKPGDAYIESFTRKLKKFAAFNGCESIVIERCLPLNIKKQLGH